MQTVFFLELGGRGHRAGSTHAAVGRGVHFGAVSVGGLRGAAVLVGDGGGHLVAVGVLMHDGLLRRRLGDDRLLAGGTRGRGGAAGRVRGLLVALAVGALDVHLDRLALGRRFDHCGMAVVVVVSRDRIAVGLGFRSHGRFGYLRRLDRIPPGFRYSIEGLGIGRAERGFIAVAVEKILLQTDIAGDLEATVAQMAVAVVDGRYGGIDRAFKTASTAGRYREVDAGNGLLVLDRLRRGDRIANTQGP